MAEEPIQLKGNGEVWPLGIGQNSRGQKWQAQKDILLILTWKKKDYSLVLVNLKFIFVTFFYLIVSKGDQLKSKSCF